MHKYLLSLFYQYSFLAAAPPFPVNTIGLKYSKSEEETIYDIDLHIYTISLLYIFIFKYILIKKAGYFCTFKQYENYTRESKRTSAL